MHPENLPVEIQPRDLAILRSLFESRIMTASHIAALHFEGRADAAKKRLQKLKAAGLIAERERKVSEPAVLSLPRKAFSILENEGILSEYPPMSIAELSKRGDVKLLTIRHELEVMNVKAALALAIQKTSSLSLAEFSTWPALNEFEATAPDRATVVMKPDGFIRTHEKESDGSVSEHTFFLELDRSTETLDTLSAKCACYMDYYRTGGFAVRNGADRSAYKEFPFRVLIVLKSAERRNNTALRLTRLTPPILTQAWLATIAEVTSYPLGAIWTRPADCLNAVKGTRFESEPPKYKTQPEREALIESRITKLHLLDTRY